MGNYTCLSGMKLRGNTMKAFKIASITAIALAAFVISIPVQAELPKDDDGNYVVVLDQYNGYFSAEETLGGLKTGTYKFVITNKAGKLVGFQVQNFKTHEALDMFPIEAGETRESIVQVTTDGIRYRCPINPTPWYNLDNIKEPT